VDIFLLSRSISPRKRTLGILLTGWLDILDRVAKTVFSHIVESILCPSADSRLLVEYIPKLFTLNVSGLCPVLKCRVPISK
jgi:hypothetical protein